LAVSLRNGSVTIAADLYGPVTDNAQSIFELSQIEQVPGIRQQLKTDYGFDPQFEGELRKRMMGRNTFRRPNRFIGTPSWRQHDLQSFSADMTAA
jgi:hypothetical protein